MSTSVINPNQPLKARFAREIGTRISLRIYWGGQDNLPGHGTGYGYHNCHTHLEDKLHPLVIGDHTHYGGREEDYPAELWPKQCETCGMPVPINPTKEDRLNRQVFNERLYDTESGRLEPGCLWWAYWIPKNLYWTNKTDFHLCAMVPTGEHWNIDSRAKNCGSPEDKLHRCWVRHGDPESGIVHVDKNGLTCNAGAGSIGTSRYHGFLHNGEFHI